MTKRESSKRADGPTHHDLSASVKNWLKKGGHPLELWVGKEFRKHNWSARHEVRFKDELSGKARLADILATRWHEDNTNESVFSLSTWNFVIECKSSPGKPWVVFSPRSRRPGTLYYKTTADPGTRDVLMFSRRKQIEEPHYFEMLKLTGFGILRALTGDTRDRDGDSTSAYAACRSVVSATKAIGGAAARAGLGRSDDDNNISVHLPMIVIDAPLFTYDLDDNDNEVLEMVDQCSVWHHEDDYPESIAIPILTKMGLAKALSGPHFKSIDSFLSAMAPHATEQNEDFERKTKAGEINRLTF